MLIRLKVGARAAHLILLLKNWLLYLMQIILWKKPKNFNPTIISIFKLGNIGDLLCTIPTIEEIRNKYPKSRLVLFTNGGTSVDARYVYKDYDTVDSIVVYDRKDTKSLNGIRKVAKILEEQKSEYTIYLSSERAKLKNVIRDIIIIKFAHVKYVEGFRISTVRMFAKAQNETYKFDREVVRQLKCLPFPYEKISFHFPINGDDKKFVESYLKQNGICDKPLLLVSMRGKADVNQWPVDQFAEVARKWNYLYGFSTIAIGGPKQHKFISDNTGDCEMLNASGQFSIAQSIYLISRAKLLITVDTGTAHMAPITNTKCVVISSSYYFSEKWMPYGNNISVLRANVDCSPCLCETCKNGDNKCINSISVDAVWSEVERMTGSEE